MDKNNVEFKANTPEAIMYAKILGLDPDIPFSYTAYRAAYKKKSREVHPDLHPELGDVPQQKVNAAQDYFNEAFKNLQERQHTPNSEEKMNSQQEKPTSSSMYDDIFDDERQETKIDGKEKLCAEIGISLEWASILYEKRKQNGYSGTLEDWLKERISDRKLFEDTEEAVAKFYATTKVAMIYPLSFIIELYNSDKFLSENEKDFYNWLKEIDDIFNKLFLVAQENAVKSKKRAYAEDMNLLVKTIKYELDSGLIYFYKYSEKKFFTECLFNEFEIYEKATLLSDMPTSLRTEYESEESDFDFEDWLDYKIQLKPLCSRLGLNESSVKELCRQYSNETTFNGDVYQFSQYLIMALPLMESSSSPNVLLSNFVSLTKEFESYSEREFCISFEVWIQQKIALKKYDCQSFQELLTKIYANAQSKDLNKSFDELIGILIGQPSSEDKKSSTM